MSIDDLVQASVRSPISTMDFEVCCSRNEWSPVQCFDRFAEHVVSLFRSASMPWRDADAAMNHAFGHAHAVLFTGFSPYASTVYEAFDQAETAAPGEQEQVTKLLLMNVDEIERT